MKKDMLLIIGANGQIGSVLTRALRNIYGTDRVIASDIRLSGIDEGPFELLDIKEEAQLRRLVRKYKITQVYHLAAILSATGELKPRLAWDVNINGLFNVLELAKEQKIRLFFPSTIAVFGSHTPRQNTPQETIIHPETVYGISKAAGENWCQYYYLRYGIDVRSLRYPGIVGYESMPGGGTTDYAVEIFHYAVQGKPYTCFLKEGTRLPMLYMPDAIRATLELMEAPAASISVRTSYNLAGMSFTPAELAASIQAHIPDFTTDYAPDFRQHIAESWSESIDDSAARKDWGWVPKYDLSSMTSDMIKNLKAQYAG